MSIALVPGAVNNQVTPEAPEIGRKYRLRRRAERQAETRRKIVEAAVALHTTVGPARTTDAAVAERAGVTRRTFYRHFPDELALWRACTKDGLQRWPPPDPERWRQLADPEQRLHVALTELYAYYREVGAGLAVIVRDFPLLPDALHGVPSRMDILRAMPATLLEGWPVEGRRRQVLAAALVHATAITTWQSLVERQHLADAEAVELLEAMVRAAAGYQKGAS